MHLLLLAPSENPHCHSEQLVLGWTQVHLFIVREVGWGWGCEGWVSGEMLRLVSIKIGLFSHHPCQHPFPVPIDHEGIFD